MKKIVSLMLVCMLITTTCFAGTFTKSSNGSSISINVDQGKTILLKAREIFGKIFTGWTITGATVADSSLSEQTITMGSGDVTATANYATPYTITVEQTANGVISPSTVTVAEGSSKTFTITPNTGHEIEDVKVDGVSVLSSCVAGTGDEKTYTMSGINGNKTLTAIYSSTGGSGSGSIIIPTVELVSKTSNSITVSTSAVNPSGEDLIYKVYVDGKLRSTSQATSSGSSFQMTAEGLTEKSNHAFAVVCQDEFGVSKGLSPAINYTTNCDGAGATSCVFISSGSVDYCTYCRELFSPYDYIYECPRCQSATGNGYQAFCQTHGNIFVGVTWNYNLNINIGEIEFWYDHCEHGYSEEHSID